MHSILTTAISHAAGAAAPGVTRAAGTSSAGEMDFGALLHDAVAGVQQLQDKAATTVEGLLHGDGVDIHTAMIATQKAGMAFDLALAVRNKAVGAYQAMMGMQF